MLDREGSLWRGYLSEILMAKGSAREGSGGSRGLRRDSVVTGRDAGDAEELMALQQLSGNSIEIT